MWLAPIFKSFRPAAFGLALALCGFGSATNTEATTASNPLPSIAWLTPPSAVAGTSAFTLRVSGSGFVTASTVNWNGAALATIYHSATTLTAAVPAGDIASAGTASVPVFNPAPGGGSSNAKIVTINATNPVPSITSLSPTSAVANGP